MRNESWVPLLKSYPDSDKINALSIGAETLYLRLIAACDDSSHYHGHPRWILSRLFTARMIAKQVTLANVATWLDELERAGLLRQYMVGPETYLELIDLKRFRRSDAKPDIRFPAPDQSGPDAGRTGNGDGLLDIQVQGYLQGQEHTLSPGVTESPLSSSSKVTFKAETIEGIHGSYPRHVGKAAALKVIAKALRDIASEPDAPPDPAA